MSVINVNAGKKGSSSAALGAGKTDGMAIAKIAGKADAVRRTVILGECERYAGNGDNVKDYVTGFALGLIKGGVSPQSAKVAKSEVRAIFLAWPITAVVEVEDSDGKVSKITLSKESLKTTNTWPELRAMARVMVNSTKDADGKPSTGKTSRAVSEKAHAAVLAAVKGRMTLPQVLGVMHECITRLALDLGAKSAIADCSTEVVGIKGHHARISAKLRGAAEKLSTKKAVKNSPVENAVETAFSQLKQVEVVDVPSPATATA